MMNQALFDVLPYMALEEYWIRTGEELAKGPAFLIVPLGDVYVLILNNVGVIARYKRLKEAQNRIKELVENENVSCAKRYYKESWTLSHSLPRSDPVFFLS